MQPNPESRTTAAPVRTNDPSRTTAAPVGSSIESRTTAAPVRLTASSPDANLAEGERLMTICNACRYCEGYCAGISGDGKAYHVFPPAISAISRIFATTVPNATTPCQYAPPHEFAVNVPQVFAKIRADSYRRYAWPTPLAKRFDQGKWILWLVALAVLWLSVSHFSGSVFYDVIPHERMVAIFLIVSLFILTAHIAGFLKFWSDTGESLARFLQPTALWKAVRDVLALANLSSHGAGCTYPNERHSQSRRVFHHFTFYGFMLCFASTTVAAIDHMLGFVAPHPYYKRTGDSGHAGRPRATDRPRWTLSSEAPPRSGHRRYHAGRQRQELYRAIVSHQPHGPGPSGPAGNCRHGPPARCALGDRAASVPLVAIRQIRPRHLPFGGPRKIGDGKPASPVVDRRHPRLQFQVLIFKRCRAGSVCAK